MHDLVGKNVIQAAYFWFKLKAFTDSIYCGQYTEISDIKGTCSHSSVSNTKFKPLWMLSLCRH